MEMWKESQLKQLSYAKEIDVAYQISLNFIKNLGFKFCAFSISSKTPDTQRHAINLNNFPTAWNIQYEQNKFNAIDPVVAHCNQSMLPILWNEDVFFQDAVALAGPPGTRLAARLVAILA